MTDHIDLVVVDIKPEGDVVLVEAGSAGLLSCPHHPPPRLSLSALVEKPPGEADNTEDSHWSGDVETVL